MLRAARRHPPARAPGARRVTNQTSKDLVSRLRCCVELCEGPDHSFPSRRTVSARLSRARDCKFAMPWSPGEDPTSIGCTAQKWEGPSDLDRSDTTYAPPRRLPRSCAKHDGQAEQHGAAAACCSSRAPRAPVQLSWARLRRAPPPWLMAASLSTWSPCGLACASAA